MIHKEKTNPFSCQYSSKRFYASVFQTMRKKLPMIREGQTIDVVSIENRIKKRFRMV
nr:hypothetical protein [uncultured Sphaerochaeta sp.]